MGSWRARASVASLAGACLFAVTTGAGAVFVGNWWGQHHGSVVTVYVTATASPPSTTHAVATHPGSTHRRAHTSEAVHDADVAADAGSAQVARVTPAASHHASRKRHLAPSSPVVPTVTPSLGASPGPSGTGGGLVPVVTVSPGVTHSPGHPSR
jgi:hypothetical protein